MSAFSGTTYELTAKFLKTIPLADRKPDGTVRQRLYWDRKQPGFGLLVGARAMSFVCQREVHGRTVRATIGRYGPLGLTVDAARKAALTKLGQLADAAAPIEPKRAARRVTLEQAWKLYEHTLRADRKSDATIKQYEYNLKKYLKEWWTRPLATLTRTDVREKHQQLAAEVAAGKYTVHGRKPKNRTGMTTANQAFKIFSATYNSALREYEALPANPCLNVRAYKIPKSRKPIADADLPGWRAAVAALSSEVHRDALLFLLFSGMRKMSVLTMRWEDVHFDDKRLHVPTPKGGGEKAFDLPLSAALVEVVRRREAQHALYTAGAPQCKPWVFPAVTGKSGHLTALPAALPNYVNHELRNTFAAVARRYAKLDHHTIATLLNHAQPGSNLTDKYAAASDDDLLESLRVPMQQVADALSALLEPPAPEDKVIPMRGKKRA